MTNSNYSKLVERYLEGEMSNTEIAEFEQMLNQDPLLSSELGFQQEIITGVKDFRKAELKTRLSNIDVTPGLLETVASNTTLQATSVALLTGVVFIGSYLWVQSPESRVEPIDLDFASRSIDLNGSQFDEKIAEELPLVEIPEFDNTSRAEDISIVETEVDTESNTVPEPISPNIVAPNLADSGSDEEVLPEVAEEVDVDLPRDTESEEIEIENISSSRKNFQYKFYNNKLYLYGDFNGIPYEILEINGRSGKKLYLYHSDLFYRIHDNVTKTSPLRRVTDPEMIEELTILKENKSE